MITCSVIQKSQLEGALRLDAEYYQPEYLEISKKLRSISCKTLDEISDKVISFGAYALTSLIEWETDDGIPFIVAGNIKEGIIDYGDVRYITEKTDEILKKSRVKEDQVLLAMSGSVGNAAVAVDIPQRLNSNQDIVKITPKKGISPYFLAAFLNSKYGKEQVLRLPVGSVQQHIFLWQIKSLLVPIVSKNKTKEVEEIYKQALGLLSKSKKYYSQAKDLLLEELGLRDFKFEDNLTFVVNLSEVKSARRADAEYFQPKYEKVISLIKAKSQIHRLNEITTVKRGSLIDPRFYDDIKGTPYIRGKDFSAGRLEKTNLVYISEDFKPRNETRVKTGDLVFASIGSVGTLALVDEGFNNSFISNNTGKIAIKDKDGIIPEYLTVVLQSIVGKLQLEKEASQTAQPKISDSQVRNFYIPTLPKSTQQKIADLVKKSYQARKKSKELLEEAKRKVEEMIEKKNYEKKD